MKKVERIKSFVLYVSKNLLSLGAFLFLICFTLQSIFKVDNEFLSSYGFAKEALAIGGILLIIYLILEFFSRIKK